MKKILIFLSVWALFTSAETSTGIPDCYKHVDQVLWVVSDVENTMAKYKELGFNQFKDLGQVVVKSETNGYQEQVRLVCANLGNANVTWVQPEEGKSLFSDFHRKQGDGAMSLIHRFSDKSELKKEIGRLDIIGINILEEITIETEMGKLHFVLMNTQKEGKFILGFTHGDSGLNIHSGLNGGNRHAMK
ncbi:MAG: hypothetical protein KAT15_25615, partial [Bacteroidales bacterium]|nr:hypothetical protein [Bacteroidales bacterium]